MLRLVCVAIFVTCALGAAVKDCKTTEWSDWGECMVEANCKNDRQDSFPVINKDRRLGEARRALSMSRHELARSQTAACRAAGTCPELTIRQSEGEVDCIGGMASTQNGDFPCQNINMKHFLSFEDLGVVTTGNPAGNDMWGWTDDTTGQEYSIVGTTHGTSFVDTTDPLNPQVLCFLETHTNPSSWRDMKVVGNTAYIVSEAPGHGMQVFDLTRLRDMTPESPVPLVTADNHYDLIGQSHNIAANPETGYLYVVGSTRDSDYTCDGGLHMIDVGTEGSLDPQFAGCFASDGYVHDTECVIYHGPDTAYTGQEICFGYNEDTLTIVDVTDKANPSQLSRTGYTDAAYTHQGWTLDSHAALLLDDELDEVRADTGDRNTRSYFWDVSDLDNPTLETTYRHVEQSIDHNQYIVQDLTYQSNYESGLRILNIDEANYALTEMGYFHLLSTTPQARYYGTWSLFPYFQTNADGYPVYIPITSIDYGFYTLEPVYSSFEATATGRQTRSRETVSGRGTCPALVETRKCEAEPMC